MGKKGKAKKKGNRDEEGDEEGGQGEMGEEQEKAGGNRDEEGDEKGGQGEMGKEQEKAGGNSVKDDCVDIESLAAEIEGAGATKKVKGKKKGAKKNNPFDEDDIIQELEELSLETQGGKVNKDTTEEVESVVPPKPEKTRKKGKKGRQYEEGDKEEGQGDMELIKDHKDEKAPPPVSIASDSGPQSHKKAMGDKTDKKKQGLSKASVKHFKEAQAKIKEEEERVKREGEEIQKRFEEQEQQRLEQERIEQERKEKRKQKEKERKERLKKEGRFLNKAQRESRARAEATLKILQAQGVEVPSKGSVSKKKPVYGDKRKKKMIIATNTPKETSEVTSPVSESLEPIAIEKETVDTEVNDLEAITSSDDDNWEAMASSDEEKDLRKVHIEVKETSAPAKSKQSIALGNTSEVEGDDEDDEVSNEEEKRAVEKGRGGQQDKRGKKSEQGSSTSDINDAENICNINLDKLRAPVVCVLGHVDTGKTKILDKLRHTNVQDGEAGGITQQIGATNVPLEAIIEQANMVKCFDKDKIKIPGMLIIDTPGHESFRNLRNRGSSLCDIAILVIDIMHGLEAQTLESIKLLKEKKCPFIVALNKIDRLYEWKKSPETDVVATLKKQKSNTTNEFNQRAKDIIVEFAQQGLNAALFYENKDPRRFVSLVPTSAHSGDGIGNLIALLVELSQTRLAKTLAHSDELKAQVMEVKSLPGIGTTIDVILINGCLREGETIIVPGVDGPIITQIRGLLLPHPMKELRVTNQYEKHKEVCTSQGVRIIGKNLEKTLAGLPLLVAHRDDEIPVLKKELDKLVKETINAIAIKKEKKGVYVQASTMGSLEALLEFLHTSKVPYAGINIGPVHRNDIMNASTMLEHDPQYAVILAFDVKVEKEIQEMADSLGVRVFCAEIIYHLFDAFTKYREDYNKAKQEEFKHIAVFPVKMKIIPHSKIYNSRDPILIGVTVKAGILRLGTPLCVPSKGFVNIGIVTGIEVNHKPMDSAKKGQDICVKIDPIPGESPKMVGRHFEETDFIVSKISRESIDALKNWFRDVMQISDWQLIKELKGTFEII